MTCTTAAGCVWARACSLIYRPVCCNTLLLCTGQLDTCSAFLLSLLGRRQYFGTYFETCQVQSNRQSFYWKYFEAQQPTFKKARWNKVNIWCNSNHPLKEGDLYLSSSPYPVFEPPQLCPVQCGVEWQDPGTWVTLSRGTLRDSRDMILITVTVLCKLCHFHFSSSSR